MRNVFDGNQVRELRTQEIQGAPDLTWLLGENVFAQKPTVGDWLTPYSDDIRVQVPYTLDDLHELYATVRRHNKERYETNRTEDQIALIEIVNRYVSDLYTSVRDNRKPINYWYICFTYPLYTLWLSMKFEPINFRVSMSNEILLKLIHVLHQDSMSVSDATIARGVQRIMKEREIVPDLLSSVPDKDTLMWRCRRVSGHFAHNDNALEQKKWMLLLRTNAYNKHHRVEDNIPSLDTWLTHIQRVQHTLSDVYSTKAYIVRKHKNRNQIERLRRLARYIEDVVIFCYVVMSGNDTGEE